MVARCELLRYQIIKEEALMGGYNWTLIDTKRGGKEINVGYGRNPICAPEHLRRHQALLNTREYLD